MLEKEAIVNVQTIHRHWADHVKSRKPLRFKNSLKIFENTIDCIARNNSNGKNKSMSIQPNASNIYQNIGHHLAKNVCGHVGEDASSEVLARVGGVGGYVPDEGAVDGPRCHQFRLKFRRRTISKDEIPNFSQQ